MRLNLETDRYTPPASGAADHPIIDAEYTIVREPASGARRRGAASTSSSLLQPLWSIRFMGRLLLWPARYLLRMAVVTLACAMLLIRPFILFFYVASFAAFCAMGYQLTQSQFQQAGLFAFWSVLFGAVPGIWDFVLERVAPDMEWKRLQL